MGKSTINRIIDEVFDTIWESLTAKNSYYSAGLGKIIKDFGEIWNMPHCLGAIDGKYIAMRQPKHSGSLWHNYKGFFSLVLLAICGTRYCFSFVDVGEYGSNSNSGIFLNPEMGDLFCQGNLNIPHLSKISGSYYELSYFLVGDKIFPLQDWLMRLYAEGLLINE